MDFNPDAYLASKGIDISDVHSGAFDPNAYLAARGVSPDEDPGALESAAAGLMSGIPLAKTAVAGVKAAFGDKSFEDEKKALSDLEDKAWEKHPVAYGAGKTGGIVGSTLIAPESAVGRIALAAGMGAGSGIDAAEKNADIPEDALKGAAVGGVLGSAAEGVSNIISKVLPKAAKGAVSSLAGGPENVETYLANPEGVKNALGTTAAAEKLADRANDLAVASGHMSDDALSKLRPDVSPISVPTKGLDPIVQNLGEDTLSPLFAPSESSLTVNGVPVGQAQRNALHALQGYKDALTQIAEQNGGKVPETALGKIVRDMQDDVNWNVDDKVVNSAKKQLEGTINALLKKSNPEYAVAMEPVSELAGNVGSLKKTFRLDRDESGNLINSDTTNQKMGTVLNEGKSNAQELLNNLGDLTGFDFLKNAKLDDVRRALTEGGNSNPILNVVGHTGGYAAGRMTGVPGGGLVGSLIGGTAAHAMDGGKIAKSLMDAYLKGSQSLTDSGARAALAKYGPMLVNAAKQGGNQLAATHFVLATSHPSYASLIDHVQQNGELDSSSSY